MHEIRLPRLGWSMEEGTFVGWLKRPGDEVAIGQPLFELEGEKALQEIESVDAGVLYIPGDAPQPGLSRHGLLRQDAHGGATAHDAGTAVARRHLEP